MDRFAFANAGTFGFWIPHLLFGVWFLMMDMLQPQWYRNRVVKGPVRLTKDSAKHAAIRVAPRLLVNLIATLLFTMWIEYQFGSWIKTNLLYRAEHISSHIQTFLIDHIASYSIISHLYSTYPWMKLFDQQIFIPFVWQSIWSLGQLFCAIRIASFWFYTFHRSFHHPRLYTWHKLHHEFSVPIALAAMYVSVPEMLLVNIVPTVLGACLTGMNIYMYGIWYGLVGVATSVSHAGHNLFVPVFDCRHHDLHHRHPNCNFGSTQTTDRWFNTLKTT